MSKWIREKYPDQHISKTLVGAGTIQTIQSSPARLQQLATDYLSQAECSKTLLLATRLQGAGFNTGQEFEP